jgi:hypothetical protein
MSGRSSILEFHQIEGMPVSLTRSTPPERMEGLIFDIYITLCCCSILFLLASFSLHETLAVIQF